MRGLSDATVGAWSPDLGVPTWRPGSAKSGAAVQRLHPDDIDLLAERIGRGVERGAYRGVSEIGRGLAYAGGR